MATDFDHILATAPQLYIRQRRELVEILVAWETVNQYAILDVHQNEVGCVAERGGRLKTMLKRWFLRSHRGFDIDVLDRQNQVSLHFSRAFFFFFSDLLVTTKDGVRLGSVHRRFGILRKKYDLKDEHNNLFATISSPIWRLWTFPVLDLSGQQRASVAKKWGGALREVFTDADTYQVDFGTHAWTPRQRAVLFAAAVSIDFDFFENNQGSNGLLDLFS